jgi:hypothetical protein
MREARAVPKIAAFVSAEVLAQTGSVRCLGSALCGGSVEGWPQRRLAVAPDQRFNGAAWETFPEGLRSEMEAHFASLARPRRLQTGQRAKCAKASTITTRRRELTAFARKAVEPGVPIEDLRSLAGVLD